MNKEQKIEYPHNKNKRKRKGICRQCGNTSDFICSKCKNINQYKEYRAESEGEG